MTLRLITLLLITITLSCNCEYDSCTADIEITLKNGTKQVRTFDDLPVSNPTGHFHLRTDAGVFSRATTTYLKYYHTIISYDVISFQVIRMYNYHTYKYKC